MVKARWWFGASLIVAGSAQAQVQVQEPASEPRTTPAGGAQPTSPTTLPAQAPTSAPTTPATTPADTQAIPPGDAPVPQRVFRDADGNPLPPELQRRIEEQMRANQAAGTMGQPGEGADLVVTGERPRGSVVGDLPPERSFDTLSVRAFGATDVSELIDAIGPQVRSNRGRGDAGPATLLNGRRVSSFAEIARIPTEAIERMDVFPEELALRYGFRADQKVVNVVTFPRFRSVVTQANALVATDGGTATGGASADQLVLTGDTRLGIGAGYNRTSALTEAERDLLQPGGNAALGELRTLLPRAERFTLNGVIGAPLGNEIGASLNAQFEATDLASRLGPAADGAIDRDSSTRRARIGSVIDGRSGRWLWSLTGGYERTSNEILTDRAEPADPRDRARSVNELAEANLIASGPLFALPAGPVTASVGGDIGARGFRGTAILDEAVQLTRLGRDRAAGRANIDIPLTRGGGIGALSVNANADVERLSDVGTLRTVGGGLVWSPIDAVDVVASLAQEEGAPTVEQLGAPTVITPAVRTFDFTNGMSVDVPRIFGGNPALVADDRRVLRVGINVTPFSGTDLGFTFDYLDTRTEDPIFSFPILTPALEDAFPARFLRDAAGGLTAIDVRPLNFARSTLRQLRSGINFSRTLGDPREGLPPGTTIVQTRVFNSEADARAWAQRRFPGGQITFAQPEPGSAAARRGETLRSRFYLSLYHNWTLADSLMLLDGGPALDRLDGFATDLRGGRRRHEIEFQIGASKSGLGARLGVNWQSPTRIAGLGGTGDLDFAAIRRVDLTMFVNPAERMGGISAPDWVQRTRVTLGITNLVNERPKVRDATGATPIAFQPALLDPLGRTVNLTLRKAF